MAFRHTKNLLLSLATGILFINLSSVALYAQQAPSIDASDDPLSGFIAVNGTGDGAADLFRENCSDCHMGDSALPFSPSTWQLSGSSPDAVLAALVNGKMQEQASMLSQGDKIKITNWLTGAEPGKNIIPQTAWCTAQQVNGPLSVHSSGWGGDLEATGYRSFAQGGISDQNVQELNLKWAFAVPGATEMRSKPAIIDNMVIFGSQFGTVYAIDKMSGCINWTYEAGSAVRGAISVHKNETGSAEAYFADFRGNLHALDVMSGAHLWTTPAGSDYFSSVTGSVAYHDGKLIIPFSTMEILASADDSYECCSHSGEIVAASAQTGEIIWRHRVVREEAKQTGFNSAGTASFGPSGAPVWSSPTIDRKRNLVYVGTGENYTKPATSTSDAILALDLDTGELIWTYQATADDVYNMACVRANNQANCPEAGPDVDFGMSPIIVKRVDGKEILIVGQKSGHVHALDPDADGELLWVTRVGRGGALGGIHWGMAVDQSKAYATIFDLPATVIVELMPLMASKPGVAALDLITGEVAWQYINPGPECGPRQMDCLTGNSGAPTVIPGAVFTGSNDGMISALSTETGDVLWQYNTDRAFDAVNEVAAHGGAVDGPGPVVANGMLFVLSGYSTFNSNHGNVLLAFEVNK